MDQHMQKELPHVAIIPSLGMGHLIPLVELAKLLVVQHGLSITFIIPTDDSPTQPQKAILHSLSDAISSIFLPPVSFHDLPEDAKVETRIALTLRRSLPALRDSLKLLHESTRLVAVVVDLFGVDAFDVAREFGVSPYLFFPSTAMMLSFVYEWPKLDETVSCEFRDLPETIRLPGCVPFLGRDLPDAAQDRKNDAYKWAFHVCSGHRLADGIMINSFMDLEPRALWALKEINKPPIYPVGPVIRTDSTSGGAEVSECLRWLDQQPHGSVLFISFGSGGTLSHQQLTELALGLEISGQRFLWVTKSPHENSNAAFFSVSSIQNPLDFLPKGFVDRTKGVGLVVPSWAPQIQILSHGSTGGFLSHCGWNSTLESIVQGVPMIAWPLYAEQKLNAVLLVDDLKVALRVEPNNDGIIKRETIANYARRLLQGEDGKLLRNKMLALKDAAAKAASEGGSSRKSLEEIVGIWKTPQS